MTINNILNLLDKYSFQNQLLLRLENKYIYKSNELILNSYLLKKNSENFKYEINAFNGLRVLHNTLKRNDVLFSEQMIKTLDGLLIETKNQFTKIPPKYNLPCWNVTRFQAIWFVYNGKLKEALDLYKKIMRDVIYSGDKNTHEIYNEALAISAILHNRPFLKKLKNPGIIFGYFDQPINDSNSVAAKKHKDFVVEDWEVEKWASAFYNIFPKEKFLIEIDEIPEERMAPGFIYMTNKEMNISPDYSNPNKVIKVGNPKKSYPQIVYFTEQQNLEVIVRLLKNSDLSINCLSSSGESALLFAIQNLNLDPIVLKMGKPNPKLFELISSMPHDKEIINTSTNKIKLTCLGCAVETGSLDIVKKLLDMGADVNQKYSLAQITPLTKAVNILASLKNRLALPENPSIQQLEAYRRYNPHLGSTLEEVKRNYSKQLHDPLYQKIFSQISSEYQKQCYYSTEKMMKIIELLLINGANPNFEYNVNGQINNYSPLMLSAECDLIEVFKLLVKHGGNIHKKCYYAQQKRELDCHRLSIEWNSNKIKKYIDSL